MDKVSCCFRRLGFSKKSIKIVTIFCRPLLNPGFTCRCLAESLGLYHPTEYKTTTSSILIREQWLGSTKPLLLQSIVYAWIYSVFAIFVFIFQTLVPGHGRPLYNRAFSTICHKVRFFFFQLVPIFLQEGLKDAHRL